MTLPIPDIIPSSKSPLKNAPTSADVKYFQAYLQTERKTGCRAYRTSSNQKFRTLSEKHKTLQV